MKECQMETQKETWFHNKWRPAIAWSYLVVCIFDFIGFPVMFSLLNENIDKLLEWTPYTLKGGGLYHLSMLAIIGVTAWGRSQEKLSIFSVNEQKDTQ
jgi:hypothetical protein